MDRGSRGERKSEGLRETGGFTLIELLVVIAIIAVLAAILFPVFAQARAKARQAFCASNIRQMGLAVTMYNQDFDERMPMAATTVPSPTPPYYTFLNWHDFVDPYVRNKQIWNCPSTTIPLVDSKGKPVCHYGFNTFYLNVGNKGAAINLANPNDLDNGLNNAPGLALAAITAPSHTVEMADAIGVTNVPANHSSTYLLPPSHTQDEIYWARPEARHSEGAVVGFVDGHVKWMRPASFYSGQTPPDSWFQAQQ